MASSASCAGCARRVARPPQSVTGCSRPRLRKSQMASAITNRSVSAKNAGGTSAWSNAWSFATKKGGKIRVAASTLNFGTVTLGTSKQDSFSITNVGDTSVNVTSIATTDQVFRYTVTAATGAITWKNTWNLNANNKAPTGIALDPSLSAGDLWVLDNGSSKQVFKYTNGRSVTNSTAPSSSVIFTMSGLTSPQGIADPPKAATAPAALPAVLPVSSKPMNRTSAVDFLFAESTSSNRDLVSRPIDLPYVQAGAVSSKDHAELLKRNPNLLSEALDDSLSVIEEVARTRATRRRSGR